MYVYVCIQIYLHVCFSVHLCIYIPLGIPLGRVGCELVPSWRQTGILLAESHDNQSGEIAFRTFQGRSKPSFLRDLTDSRPTGPRVHSAYMYVCACVCECVYLHIRANLKDYDV
jgi:hypothetical protein